MIKKFECGLSYIGEDANCTALEEMLFWWCLRRYGFIRWSFIKR